MKNFTSNQMSSNIEDDSNDDYLSPSMKIFRSTSVTADNFYLQQLQHQQQQKPLQSQLSQRIQLPSKQQNNNIINELPEKLLWSYEPISNNYNYYEHSDNLSNDEANDNSDNDNSEEQSEQERLQSLEALRYALYNAPFCRNMHTLMTIPNEECFEMIGVPTKCAIRIESFSYNNILDNINLEIPKGKIFSILGSSNNGKSLLLKCILGRGVSMSKNKHNQQLTNIEVFGQHSLIKPLSSICVGYMPQQISLHYELNIEQTLLYYGNYYQLPKNQIKLRIQMLNHFFLESKKYNNNRDGSSISIYTLVRNLDTSSLYRLSLMIACIHSPPLLLLDEPTDNVDPFVRSSIWSYLENLSEKEGTTIVFTTKHPEELSYAYKAGLIRDGHIYVEDRPEELLRNYHCRTYIQMYNKFCMFNIPRRIRPSIAYFHSYHQQHHRDRTKSQSINNDDDDIMFDGKNFTIPPPSQLSYQTTQSQSLGEIDQSDYSGAKQRKNRNDSFLSCSDITSTNTDFNDGINSVGEMDLQDLQRASLPLPMAQWPIAERRRTKYITNLFNFNIQHLYSLIMKNYFVIIGNIRLIIIFYFIFPILQIVFVCFLSNRPLTSINNLPITIVTPKGEKSFNHRINKLINYTINRSIFKPEFIINENNSHIDESIERLRNGKTLAVVVPWLKEQALNYNSSQIDDYQDNDNFEENMSYCERFLHNYRVGLNSTMFGLRLYLDGSNFFLNYLTNHTLSNSMEELLMNDELLNELITTNCSEIHSSMKMNHIPISLKILNYENQNNQKLPATTFEKSTMNDMNKRFRLIEFILPGTLIAIIFAYSLVLTSYLFIKEEINGLHDRCLTAGVSGIEILCSHMISQTLLFFLKEIILIFLMKNFFNVPKRMIHWFGPWSLISLIGLMGIVAGLFVGVICPKPKSAAFFISGIFIPGFVLSGIIWPIESLPQTFYYFSLLLPLTQPINSLRDIIYFGIGFNYNILHYKIIIGYIVTIVYIILLLLLTLIIFKIKTST